MEEYHRTKRRKLRIVLFQNYRLNIALRLRASANTGKHFSTLIKMKILVCLNNGIMTITQLKGGERSLTDKKEHIHTHTYTQQQQQKQQQQQQL